MRTYLPIGIVVTSALTSALGIALPIVWPLAPLGLAGIIYVACTTPSVRSLFLAGLFYGFVTAGAGIWWFWDTIPLDWLGLHNPTTQFLAVLVTWSYINVFMAVPIAMGLVGVKLLRKSRTFPLVAALIWVLAEYGRMWGFALATWGKESILGPHFSAASIGYVLAENTYLLQLAHPFGIAALNFVVALFAATIVMSLLARSDIRLRLPASVGIGVLIVIAVSPVVFPYRPNTSEESPVRVALTTTDLPAGDQDIRPIQMLLTELHDSREAPDVVLLPEGHGLSSVYPGLTDEERRKELLTMFGPEETIVLYANARQASITYESTTRGVFGHYQKLFLMPMGEYPPYFAVPFFSILGDKSLTTYAKTAGGGVERGGTLAPFTYKNHVFGPLLCSDLISPGLYNQYTRVSGATVLVALSNQSWFHHSMTLYTKNLEIAKMHAVQNRAWLLNSVNGAPSFAISPTGSVIYHSAWGETGVKVIEVP